MGVAFDGEAPAASQRVHSRQGGWSLDEVADAEMGHVRNSFGAVVVPEFRSGFLAGVHSGDSSAAGVMGRPPVSYTHLTLPTICSV